MISGSGRQAVEKTLQVLGIIDLVDVIVCAGETEKGKPHPDPFLAAAHQLDIRPEIALFLKTERPEQSLLYAPGCNA